MPGYLNTDLTAQLYMYERKRSGVGGLVYLLRWYKCGNQTYLDQKVQVTAVIVAC